MMKAMMSVEVGGPETLELRDIELAAPGPDEVRIAVRAAGVNFPDTLIIRDKYQFRPPRPFAPGGEVAGIVEAVGENISHVKPGDRVLASMISGGYATHVLAESRRVWAIPDQMTFEHAACFLLTYATTYYALQDRGTLKAGDDLLILGASGGIGVSAMEIGKALGARVIAAVSSESKAAFCREHGADETIVYGRSLDRDAQKALSASIKSLAKGEGVDVVYDAVGGDYAEPALRAIGWEGRYLVIGFPAGIPKIPLNLTLLKNCQIVGVFWGAFTERQPERFAEHMADMFALYCEGKIQPRISATYPLQEAKKALQEIEARRVVGKSVLVMD